MDIVTEYYNDQKQRLADTGRRINATVGADGTIVVYQAFRASIAQAAVADQQFGGGGYRYERMSWIKTSFLWMMYRSGWAQKEGQEHILAITLKQADFDQILQAVAWSSFSAERGDYETWRSSLAAKPARLQWDPDHDPYGNPKNRRAIQIGMKDDLLRQFGQTFCLKIEDITPFVAEQWACLQHGRRDDLRVPKEVFYMPASEAARKATGVTID